jgi:malonate decarboxylase beta subunit
MSDSYFEATARQRLAAFVDAGSFVEFVPPEARVTSPHLAALDTVAAFDDGIAVGAARLGGKPILIAAQEGGFMGGAVGEAHGAKLVGLFGRALDERPAAVVLLLESGGVRLHEANAGLIAVSEIMRAVLAVRAAAIPVIVLDGGAFGCFGGMGIVARLSDAVVMSEEGRLGLSGPEVIETVAGVEEFDSRDRALVWRTVGGKHRYLLGEAAALVPDTTAAFRAATLALIEQLTPDMSLAALEAEHARLADRLARFGACHDAVDVWRALGIPEPERLPTLDTAAFLAATAGRRA